MHLKWAKRWWYFEATQPKATLVLWLILLQNLESEIMKASEIYLKDKRHFDEQLNDKVEQLNVLERQLKTERQSRSSRTSLHTAHISSRPSDQLLISLVNNACRRCLDAILCDGVHTSLLAK